ncbi:MAG: sulfite exporter TauE/SafE family protein [Proteobacteria bacterium]|nr:sulfite exporter TauE/SafE family protein [Pseudomonadota bacterium]MBU4582157.1 sulfite exporter TauE/SafE family protein [Pseudomonadota bacterium]MCG2740200.1 sulfite exporter TauE/SafE family protein [Syntrophaceae bacterium]
MVENFVGGLSAYLQESVFLSFLAVYLGGVLISFTPCIYPVVPITVAFIGARGGSKGRAFFLSLIYVLGMAVTYTILGAVAALSGKLFGQIQSNPWTYFVIGNICILMGLSMFDLFALSVRTPDFITRVQSKKRTEGIAGAFGVGAASGLVTGPCTAPVLAVLLSYAATRQNVAFASALMFVFALGMGTLLILAGTFTGLLAGIPKSGVWMVRINRLFGWILLGAGEYFLINAGMLWV